MNGRPVDDARRAVERAFRAEAGRAIAGARGNESARIFTTCLDPQLVAIAGVYRTIESPLPDEVAGKPAQIRRVGDSLLIEPL